MQLNTALGNRFTACRVLYDDIYCFSIQRRQETSGRRHKTEENASLHFTSPKWKRVVKTEGWSGKEMGGWMEREIKVKLEQAAYYFYALARKPLTCKQWRCV